MLFRSLRGVAGDILWYSVKYLHRHPSELDLTIDQMAEVAMIGKQIDKLQIEAIGALGGIG